MIRRILYILPLLALASLACADNGQNTAAIVGTVAAASSQAATGGYIGAGLILALGLLHVLATQSQHWSSQQTIAKSLQTIDSMAQSLASSTPTTVTTTTTAPIATTAKLS
jgi:hypothetical protein